MISWVPEGQLSTQRVMDIWEKIPEEVAEAGTTVAFKSYLYRYMDRIGQRDVGKILVYETSLDQITWHG